MGWPLAFSPDGNYIAGGTRTIRITDGITQPRLIVWDVKTGQGRVLDNGGQPHKDPTPSDGFSSKFGPPPNDDLVSYDINAITFPDNGQPFLFAHYRNNSVVTAWNLDRGKAVHSYPFISKSWDLSMQSVLSGRGDPLPDSHANCYRFRLAVDQRILALPKYN